MIMISFFMKSCYVKEERERERISFYLQTKSIKLAYCVNSLSPNDSRPPDICVKMSKH